MATPVCCAGKDRARRRRPVETLYRPMAVSIGSRLLQPVDRALAVSQSLETGTSRLAGQGGTGLLIAPPLQTVDASQLENLRGADPNNHGYVSDARQVRQDLVAVLQETPLDHRDCILDAKGRRTQPGAVISPNEKLHWTSGHRRNHNAAENKRPSHVVAPQRLR